MAAPKKAGVGLAGPRVKSRVKRPGRHAKRAKARDRRTPLCGPRNF
jgi:hypothetical protein